MRATPASFTRNLRYEMHEMEYLGTLDFPGLARSLLSPDGYAASRSIDAKLVIIMVGLPARGKSYIVRKLARYLNWLQYGTRVFNVGERRRSTTNATNLVAPHSAAFFDPNNPEFVELRDRIAIDALNELLDWLMFCGGTVGILDATNNTQRRRQAILSHIRQRPGSQPDILFLESCCFDQSLLERNFRLKLSGPDYRDQNPETAFADFCRRVSNYERSYVPLGVAEESLKVPYVQMIDVGRKINTHLIRGYLATQVVEYLLNFNLAERQIWISCNGQSMDDAMGKIGRGSPLSDQGRNYANALASFMQEQRDKWKQTRVKYAPFSTPLSETKDSGGSSSFCIWTSMMPQAIETSATFPDHLYKKKQIKLLDDLNAGHMAGLTFEEIRTLHPAESASRERNKLLYRWPGTGGEAYADVINRLRPVILDLERMTDHLLLITHRAVVRVLLSYFMDLQRDDLANLVVPSDSVFCLEPEPYGISVQSFRYDHGNDTFHKLSVSRGTLLRRDV